MAAPAGPPVVFHVQNQTGPVRLFIIFAIIFVCLLVNICAPSSNSIAVGVGVIGALSRCVAVQFYLAKCCVTPHLVKDIKQGCWSGN